jgi:glycosyltransferase involved in cell wall biosynthesis
MTIKALFPVYNTGEALSHICLSLCEQMRRDGETRVELMVPTSGPGGRRAFTRDALPAGLRRLAYRVKFLRDRVAGLMGARFLRWIEDGEIAYLWPCCPIEVFREMKRRGNLIVTERVNCHTATARMILDEAYARVGRAANHGITQARVEAEREELELSDYVFSPSPLVTRSLLANGVDERKVLETSYGWEPKRIERGAAREAWDGGVTVTFVGRLSVRKGTHLLLEAWTGSGVKGRLVLAGEMDAEIAEICGEHLARADVRHVGHVRDVGSVYRSADVFAFPSLEEGDPLVTHEAMASGVPLLVSPMGAGRGARDGEEGLVIEPYDAEGWIEGLKKLAGDAELRRRFGASAAKRAREFTWEKVAGRRREQVMAIVRPRSSVSVRGRVVER